MRRPVGGMLGMPLAALVLLAWLVAPSLPGPMPGAGEADAVALAGLRTICFSDAGNDRTRVPDPAHPPAHDKCLLCPACHLASQVAIPASGKPAFHPAVRRLAALAGGPPPATGPPSRPRPVAQPTGPPLLPV